MRVRVILRLAVVIVTVVAMLAGVGNAVAQKADNQHLLEALKQGQAFAIMRHALAPGTGDPDNFNIDDCSTQRNLSDEGREQARAMGKRFRAAGIEAARVYSSAWCRCKETAELLGLGRVEVFPPLSSFLRDSDGGEAQKKALKDWLQSAPLTPPVVLVTHQVNLTALTGAMPKSSELFVVKRLPEGGFEVLGSIEP